MKRYRVAIIGLGYIGYVHLEALSRIGQEVTAIADADRVACEKASEQYGINNIYDSYQKLIDACNLDAVHICTPNHTHYDIAMYAIKQKINVLCEKPLALTTEQAKSLTKEMKKSKKTGAVNFNYRYYPVLQYARKMILNKDIGKVNIIKGSYLQDWLLFDTDYNWRLDKDVGGKSRAIADIGSHWCDLAEHITGLKITSVLADLMTIHDIRKKAKGDIKTFELAADATEYEEKPMTTEDYAGVLVRFENGAKGIFSVSQVSAGQKCRIKLEVYGGKKSINWDHEQANSLWIGTRTAKSELITRDMGLMNGEMNFAHVPAGHPEGYPDVVKNICIDFYQCIENNQYSPTLPRFDDGLRQSIIVDAILKSSKLERWVKVEEV